jgi:ATP-dependent Clp protease ATP-binding subunit ClpC
MYERFTDRAREAVKLAHLEARRFNHDYIGTEHELLGLVKVGGGTAAVVLKNANLNPVHIQREVENVITPGPSLVKKRRGLFRRFVSSDKLPQTPRAKKVIEYAMEEARALNHNYIGTEHLLLGLLREKETVAAQVLTNLGLNLDDVRRDVVSLLAQGKCE